MLIGDSTLVSIAARTQRLRRPATREMRRTRRLRVAVTILAILALVGAGIAWLQPF